MEVFVAIIIAAIAFVAGVGLGFAGYRYFLKRHPESLEKLAGFVHDVKDGGGKRWE